jgi:hypothetical protein
MNNLIFANNGVISLIDLLSIGDSHKKDDSSTIGQFNTGLITALAIAVRNDITINIYSGAFKYTPEKGAITDTVSGKTKEIILLNQYDVVTGELIKTHETAFGIYLGLNWSVAMISREVFSNCLDERGLRVTEVDLQAYDTHVEIVNNHPEIQDVIDNWGAYFLEEKEVLTEYNNIKIMHNDLPGSPYVIYKNGIQVYRNTEVKSMFLYNCKNVSIDEMRILLDRNSAEIDISYAIRATNNYELINYFLDNLSKDFVEWDNTSYGTYSHEWVNVVNDRHEAGTLDKFPFSDKFSEDHRFNVGVKSIQSNPSDYWSTKIRVEEIVQEEEKFLSFEENVKQIALSFGLELLFPIKESVITQSIVAIADRREKTIYVDSRFSEDDCWELVREQFKLLSDDKDYIYKKYLELLNVKELV